MHWRKALTSLAFAAAVCCGSARSFAAPPPRLGIKAAAVRPQDSSAGSTFQAVGLSGDLAVVSLTRMESAAVFVVPDSTFQGVAVTTGLALDPTSGTVYVLGHDFLNSYLGTLDFTSGAETTIGTIPNEIVVDLAFDGGGHLYGLTESQQGADPHALLAIDKATAAASVAKVLDPHGGKSDFYEAGALAWNAGDQSFYYADLDQMSAAEQTRCYPVKIAVLSHRGW